MKIQRRRTFGVCEPVGIDILLSGDEVAKAIDAYLVAHGVIVHGPRTVRVNGKSPRDGSVYVDQSGVVQTHVEEVIINLISVTTL